MTSKHDYIQEAAYFIWLNRGRPEGQDLEIWDEATKLYELTQQIVSTPKKQNKKVAKKTATKKPSVKKAVKTTSKKAPAKKTQTIKAVAPVAKPKAKIAKKSITVKTTKPVAKKAPAKKAPAKKPVAKPATKKVEIAKIIPMVKKDVDTKKATAPKTKIKIVVGGKK